MKYGKEWKWPSDTDLIAWEDKVRGRNGLVRSISPGNILMLIRAVRGQRKVIEKLAKLLAMEGGIEGSAGLRGLSADTPSSTGNLAHAERPGPPTTAPTSPEATLATPRTDVTPEGLMSC